MAKVAFSGLMDVFISVILREESCMDTADTLGKMAENTKESIGIIRNTVWALTNILMVVSTVVSGTMVSNMVKVQ